MTPRKPPPPGHYAVKASDVDVDLSTPGVVKYRLKPGAQLIPTIPMKSKRMKRLKRDP